MASDISSKSRPSSGDSVIKGGVLCKRSIVKRKMFATQNFKNRYFELTKSHLNYYDGDAPQNRGKLKGSVTLLCIKIVKEVEDKCLDNKSNVFQIVYIDTKDFPILYVVAKSTAERQAWITAISEEAVTTGAQFFAKYHPGVWTKKLGYYNCCDQCDRNAIGCRCDNVSHRSFSPPLPPPRPDPSAENRTEYIALFDYEPTEEGDLELIQGEKYIVLNKSAENWWHAENREGRKGYIPANYVKINSGLEQYEWYYKECTRERSVQILMKSAKDGCFLIRDSVSNPGHFSLSIFTTENGGNVRHYQIKLTDAGKYYVSATHTFNSIPELVHYHKHSGGGIYSRLREPPPRRNKPSTAGFSHDKWKLDLRNLDAGEELGRGCFGVVYRGTYKNIPVAIKEMTITPTSDEFIQEVKTMTKLHHPNIVQLYGVIFSETNPKIVTELLINGALNTYLQNNQVELENNQGKLLDFSLQVCCGMEYLSGRKIIHRDLAARNCLVGKDEVVKVGDFGLARIVLMDNEYHMSERSKFPFKWSPPEVLQFRKYNDKSDVWAYGILLWEIYSFGVMPYSGLKNPEVTKFVAIEKKRLNKPMAAPFLLYEIMLDCWKEYYDDRPTFSRIKRQLEVLTGKGDYIPTEPAR